MGANEIKDLAGLAGLAKPVSKFIGALRATAGVLYEPSRIRNKAKAEADAAVIAAEARLTVSDIESRATERVQAREIRRQENIERIVEGAVEELPASTEGDNLEADWMAEFLNHCQDISDSDMQQVWSRILAGEFIAPGRYSLRALNFVKLLSKRDAELFAKFCSYLWLSTGRWVHFRTDATMKFLESQGLSIASLLELAALGLLNIEHGLSISPKVQPGTIISPYFGKTYRFKSLAGGDFNLGCIMLTNLGKELMPLCQANPSEEYLSVLRESLREKSYVILEEC